MPMRTAGAYAGPTGWHPGPPAVPPPRHPAGRSGSSTFDHGGRRLGEVAEHAGLVEPGQATGPHGVGHVRATTRRAPSTDGEGGMAQPQPGVAPLVGVAGRSAPVLDQEQREPALRLGEVGGVHRPQDGIGGDALVEAARRGPRTTAPRPPARTSTPDRPRPHSSSRRPPIPSPLGRSAGYPDPVGGARAGGPGRTLPRGHAASGWGTRRSPRVPTRSRCTWVSGPVPSR